MLPRWETVAFATLVLSELLRAFTARSERISLFKIGVFSNKWMVVCRGLLVRPGARGDLRAVPAAGLRTVPLTFSDWLWIMPFALLASIAAELTKIYLRYRAKKIETVQSAEMELA